MGGGETLKIPTPESQTIKGIKELEKLQERLAAKGLKDPWIRLVFFCRL